MTHPMPRVLYVSPMPYGANATVDALCHGLDSGLAECGITLFVAYADFAEPDWREQADLAVRAGIEAAVDAIVIWVVDPEVPRAATAVARAHGIPVIALERPRFPVDAAVVYPNFNQGVYMSEYLATLLPTGGRVAVVGGPDVVDDIELMIGLQHGLSLTGLVQVNDPEDPRYKNVSDVASGGYEITMNILADFGRLDGLIPYNDETMLGAVQALTDTGRLGEVKMVSRNGTPKAVELVRAGIHHGTWDIDGPGIGLTVAGLVRRAVLEGEVLCGLLTSSPMGRMITSGTAAAWIPWTDRIAYRLLTPAADLASL